MLAVDEPDADVLGRAGRGIGERTVDGEPAELEESGHGQAAESREEPLERLERPLGVDVGVMASGPAAEERAVRGERADGQPAEAALPRDGDRADEFSAAVLHEDRGELPGLRAVPSGGEQIVGLEERVRQCGAVGELLPAFGVDRAEFGDGHHPGARHHAAHPHASSRSTGCSPSAVGSSHKIATAGRGRRPPNGSRRRGHPEGHGEVGDDAVDLVERAAGE
ncbi:hypothetical protein GB864_17290 [Agromyces sp. MMS17-SY077]|uniref:Uncharacterized protein n=1 Tax=Agromyces seonyuensis TaxID=2662446 RepID=A0A6I4P8M2_9MICO|nr:hypothetical protein [Agromyces seonyuensis]